MRKRQIYFVLRIRVMRRSYMEDCQTPALVWRCEVNYSVGRRRRLLLCDVDSDPLGCNADSTDLSKRPLPHKSDSIGSCFGRPACISFFSIHLLLATREICARSLRRRQQPTSMSIAHCRNSLFTVRFFHSRQRDWSGGGGSLRNGSCRLRIRAS